MQRSDFRDLVLTTLEPHGAPYVETASLQNALINRRLRLYTQLTMCLYDDAVPFTLEVDEPLYDLFGDGFTKDLCRVDSIWINGNPLTNYQGNHSPASMAELRRYNSSYLTQESATPDKWVQISPKTVRLFPAPDQVYANNFAQGNVLHSEIDVSEAGDTEEIEIPDPYVDNSAVFWCVVGFLRGNASVAGDFELMKGLSEDAWSEMRGLQSRARQMTDGPIIRGGRMNSGVVDLQ